jgi:peptidoglycan/LPS O-acetylase OafA/YrhL
VYLGNASYSIYLVHFVTLSMLAKIAKWSRLDSILPSQILFCLHVLGAIAAGCIFHHLVDERIHRWAKRFFAKKPEAAPSTVVAEPARKAA